MVELWEQGCSTCAVRNEFVIPEIVTLIRQLRPSTIIDVGCGTGYIARNVIANGCPAAEWVLIDVDQDRLDFAAQIMSKMDGVSFLNTNIFEPHVQNLQADLVVIANTILEFSLPREELERIGSLVMTGGHLSVFIPDTLSDIVDVQSDLTKYVEGTLKLKKIDKFTGEPYPFFAHRPISVVIQLLGHGFELIKGNRTDLGNGQFHFCFRKQAIV